MATTSVTLDDLLKRINDLEQNNGSFTRKILVNSTISSGTVTIPDISKWDAILLEAVNVDMVVTQFIDTSTIVWGGARNFPGSTGDTHEDWIYYRFPSPTQIQINGRSSFVGITKIIGYKWG